MTFLPYKIATGDWINVLAIVRAQRLSPNNWTITLLAGVTLNNISDAQVSEIRTLLIYANPVISTNTDF